MLKEYIKSDEDLMIRCEGIWEENNKKRIQDKIGRAHV